MDFSARRSHVYRVMIAIYAVFGFALVYFLFFNTGLTIGVSPSGSGNDVMVSNDSVHAIRDVSIVYVKDGQRQALEVIPLLSPRESRTIMLTPAMVDESGQVELQVMAPFHLTTRALIPVGMPSPDDGQVTFQFSYPPIGYVGQDVEVIASGCNTASSPQQLQLAMELPTRPEWVPAPVDWVIPANDCSSTGIAFTPTLGEEDLPIKIRVLTAWRTLGEGLHSIDVTEPPSATTSTGTGA
ncbi:MAG: hypothetical protein IPJ89_00235 [Candidatus Iainarchaeum archaeon]|uniref:Uncharacterized protein n=1 Tax=Candidatus Iainarchaeum sp. TaxID=3101447 RepID=A0A7T9I231_9ARCH|nr:MAG: hypothetical protein IPJ89_00235 [Candidatus Diapherotrites archaeon]